MKNLDGYKQKLEEELKTLEAELKSVGRVNPSNPADWEPVPEKMDILASDQNEVADSMEAFEENAAILKQLEIRYNEVKSALKRIAEGAYGNCAVGGEAIEEDRLNANPAATTCKRHMG
ncbi:MAG: DnaK suppressor protein [Parcubacteria group bacterium Gr01-1014_72]|nr:MAG: DnaK suppressor protein [Parcubacteria group bacterium Gr01-1014_72]